MIILVKSNNLLGSVCEDYIRKSFGVEPHRVVSHEELGSLLASSIKQQHAVFITNEGHGNDNVELRRFEVRPISDAWFRIPPREQ